MSEELAGTSIEDCTLPNVSTLVARLKVSDSDSEESISAKSDVGNDRDHKQSSQREPGMDAMMAIDNKAEACPEVREESIERVSRSRLVNDTSPQQGAMSTAGKRIALQDPDGPAKTKIAKTEHTVATASILQGQTRRLSTSSLDLCERCRKTNALDTVATQDSGDLEPGGGSSQDESEPFTLTNFVAKTVAGARDWLNGNNLDESQNPGDLAYGNAQIEKQRVLKRPGIANVSSGKDTALGGPTRHQASQSNARSRKLLAHNEVLADQKVTIDNLKTQNNGLLRKIENLLAENERQERSIRRIQDQAFASINKGGWEVPEDATVERRMDNLESAITDWAMSRSEASWAVCLQRLDREDSGKHYLWESFAVLKNKKPLVFGSQKLPPWAFVAAWLSHYIHRHVFEKPLHDTASFFAKGCESSDVGPPQKPNNHGDSIAKLLSIFTTGYGSTPEVISWRALTLRLMHPQIDSSVDPASNTSGAAWIGECAQHQKTERARVRAYMFLQAAGAFIARFKPGDERPARELQAIFEKAIDLSVILWTQKSELKLRAREFVGVPYKDVKELVQPSRLHNVELHDNEDCLNDKAILLVTQPMAKMLGDSEGIYPEHERPMKRAVVFLGDVEIAVPMPGQGVEK